MTDVSQLAPGTLPVWGTFLAMLSILGLVLRVWIVGLPDRRRADNEAHVIEGSEMERVVAELRSQIKDLRAEVHLYRNEVQALQSELSASKKLSNQRSDRIDTLQIIIELLLSELERIDPDSLIVKQAKLMLRRSGGDVAKPDDSDAMSTAKGAVRDAKQAVRSAEHTVVEINVNEAKDRSREP